MIAAFFLLWLVLDVSCLVLWGVFVPRAARHLVAPLATALLFAQPLVAIFVARVVRDATCARAVAPVHDRPPRIHRPSRGRRMAKRTADVAERSPKLPGGDDERALIAMARAPLANTWVRSYPRTS